MARQIPYAAVVAVLLDDGWHTVQGKSFVIDELEFGTVGQAGNFESRYGAPDHHTGMAPGFSFVDTKGDRYTGSLRAIHAIREDEPKPTLLPAEA